VRFSLLGPLAVRDAADAAVPVPGSRIRVILAALLVRAGTPVPLDALAEIVWDGAPPSAYAATLRSHVRRLRAVLGPRLGARISTQDIGYCITVDESELDILRFEELARRAEQAVLDAAWDEAGRHAAEALGLWRAEPLADIPSQRLRDQTVPRLTELRLRLLEYSATAESQAGRYEQLVPRLRELTREHPLRERFHEQLMAALAGSGRRAEALAAYHDVRRVLVGELGIEPGPELRRLHEGILAGQREPGWAPPPPRQLPAAATYFVGRDGELELLRGMADRTGAAGEPVAIAAVDGMGGVGKTALTVHLAHNLADRFPDGQLFIDLHGHTEGSAPRDAHEALAVLLRALDVPPQRIPERTEERAGLYRQCLAGTRTLLVLDNAADEAQVRPLLPGTSGCMAVITSRRRLRGLHEARSLSLGLLTRDQAIALLGVVAGAERVAPEDPLSGEVARLCGYLPLALRIAGALLRHRPAWSLEHLTALLTDQDAALASLSDGERDLTTVLDLSYNGLGEQHRLLIRRLGLAPGPDADVYAAAALLRIEPAVAARMLDELLDRHLLIEHAPGRYRMHDLVRARARSLADADPPGERDAALDRLLRYYTHTAQTASIPVARYPRPAPHGPAPDDAPALPDRTAALAWLRTHRDNLEAAYDHAVARDLSGHAIALAAGLGEILRADGLHLRALQTHRVAAELAERHGDPAVHAAALTALGIAQRLTGDLAGAERAVRAAVEIHPATGDRGGQAYGLAEFAIIKSLDGDLAAAEDAFSRALEIYRALGDRGGQAAALADLGKVWLMTGRYAETRTAFDEALDIYRTIGHQAGTGYVLHAIGSLLLSTGAPAGAVQALREAVRCHRAAGYRDGEAHALSNLAYACCLTGDLAEAGTAAREALEIHRETGHRSGEAHALGNLAYACCLTGDLAEAETAAREALEIHRTTGHRAGEAVVLNYLGYVRTLTGDPAGAEKALREALEIHRAVNHHEGEGSALVYLSHALRSAGDAPGAEKAAGEALAVFVEIDSPGNQVWALQYQADAVAAMGDTRRALTLYRRGLALAREVRKPASRAACIEGLGACRLAMGNESLGISHLRQALAAYRSLGMVLDARRVDIRLNAAIAQ
jgi:DNA-binding SARP family transcriptional activator/tetratricopeptide (TPR) repeat protein